MSALLLAFEIAGLPAMTANKRDHWSKRHRETRKWKHAVATEVWARFPSQASRDAAGMPLKRARLVLTRCSSVEPDGDNALNSMKSCIDGLVESGVIVNDKLSNIGVPEVRWEKARPGKGMIRVEVWRVGEQV
jgi:hypothetical protein